MGKGNPHRQSGVGRNAGKGWKMEQILESGLVSPKALAHKGGKEKKADVISLNSKKLVDAGNIHAGPSIPKPADKSDTSRIEPAKAISKKPYSLKNDLEHWNDDDNKMLNAVAEVLDRASDEKIIELEKEIAGFSPAEKRFIDPMDDDYSNEFWEEKRKMEKRGGKTTDRWVSAFRDSYINKRLGWGNERQLAPEKKTVLEKYLNLKLPVGIPEEKTQKPPENTEKVNNEVQQNLTIKNKHMGVSKKESFPAGAGFMGAPVDLDAREAEEVKARRTGTEDKKEKEPEFSPEEAEEIKKIAHLISERRMAGKDDAARKWQAELAKEYGLDENAFSKETIEKLLSDNGLGDKQWTPEAQKFMQDWDWGKAEEAFRNMKKVKEQEEKENVDIQGKTEEPFYPPVVVSGSERERSVVPIKPDVYTAEPIPGKPQQKALEGSSEKTLEDLKADLDVKADVYATARGNAKGSRGYLAKLLGISKNVEESGEVKKARLEYLQAKLEHSEAAAESAFKEYQDKLQGGATSPEELEALRIKWEAISNYHNRASDIELQGKFVEKTVEYYKTKGGPLGKVFGKYLDLYNNVYLKKVPPKVRAAISIAMLGGAVAGLAGAFGVTGIFVGAASIVAKPARFFLAPLFPAMTYMGTGKMMEKGLQWQYGKKGKKRSAAFGEIVGKMKSGEVSVEETRKNILKLLEEQNKECGDDLVNRGWWEDRCDQVRNLLTTVVGARATMVLMSGTEAIGSFFEEKGSDVAGVAGASPKGAGSAQAWAETTHAAGAEVQTPEIAKPQFEEIDSVKIKTGGSMWKGIENSIRANPEAYHLDSKDPNFRKIMNGKIAEMLHAFADKKGLSYEQLDKVFADDTFKLMHDSTTGKFYLDDYQGKAFGGDVSHDGAGAVQETASNKPQIAPEGSRPRAGAADHQPLRGEEKTMQYDSDTPAQKIAKEHYAQAVQNQENLAHAHAEQSAQDMAELARINNKLYLDTRGLVNLIVNEAGVGNRANFWEHSMDNWKNLLGSEYQISQDVQFNDATEKTNSSLDKLRRLYPILEKYHRQGIESIGDCLKEAVKDPANVLKINMHVLTNKR